MLDFGAEEGEEHGTEDEAEVLGEREEDAVGEGGCWGCPEDGDCGGVDYVDAVVKLSTKVSVCPSTSPLSQVKPNFTHHCYDEAGDERRGERAAFVTGEHSRWCERLLQRCEGFPESEDNE